MKSLLLGSLVIFGVLMGISASRHRLTHVAAQSPGELAIVSAAHYDGATLAAEEIVSAFGSGLATMTVAATTQPLPVVLGGTSVKVRDSQGAERLAPLFFVSPTQLNFQIPAGTAIGTATFTVVKSNGTAALASTNIVTVAPSLFSTDASGRGLAAANVLRIRADNSQSYEQIGRYDAQQSRFVANPIELGASNEQIFLILYGTGLRHRRDLNAVRAYVGGVSAEVSFAGAQGSFAGLDQINLRLPRDLNNGELDVFIKIDEQVSNTVRIAVKGAGAPTTAKTYLATLRAEGSAVSPGAGYGSLRLSADEKFGIVKFNYANLTTPEISAHIHGPADPGQNAPILFDFDTVPKQVDGSYQWTFANVGTLTAAQMVQALKAGRLYINIHSSRYPAGEIRGHFNLINGAQTFTTPPPAPPLPTGTPTLRDAARFLTQATFGGKYAEITALPAKSYDHWLNEQFAQPLVSHFDYLDAILPPDSLPYQEEMMGSFWQQAIAGPDQLRQRVSFALQQIIVVSFKSNLDPYPLALASYLDTLNRNAFGNFRQLLEQITLNPAMGRYLDHLGNDKEDPVTGRNPNENYAREILQLFSIGLYQLHPDGSLVLDANGLPIPTYDQNVIKGFAHVFTGWSFGSLEKTEANWAYPPISRRGTAYWRAPMQAWPQHHSTGEKQLLGGVKLPANQTPGQDLQAALDNIFNHPNVGPFISRQLIQRLITSNPSPGYVYRVAQKFNNNGAGVRGDMKAVIRAILLDHEARSLEVISNQGYGKLREPILRFAHLLRTFDYRCPCGNFPIFWLDNAAYSIGQNPLRAPSVFNFYEPNYSPAGTIAQAGLYAPEFQLLNDTSVIGFANYLFLLVREGFYWTEEQTLKPDFATLLPLAADLRQLIERLDLLLTAGNMPERLKTSLVTEISKLPSNNPRERVATAIHLILTSPDYVIQK
jgi:uncharacterized protein (TIGR03437 family)